MKHFISIVKNILTKEPPKPLGRWNINYSTKNLNKKIDLSNEDHCGVCHQYILKKQKIEIINKKI